MKKKLLNDLKKKMQKFPQVYKLFEKRNWFKKVEEQINIWEDNPKGFLAKGEIVISEYELFRYFADIKLSDTFIKFLNAFTVIEKNIKPKSSQVNQWNKTKNLLFSKNLSQIFSSLFEILVLGKLINTEKKVEPYYKNIDGRIEIENRYVYFEIKSLQKSEHDRRGIGAKSTEFDKRQIFRALRDKVNQLYPYRDNPSVIFLSLYRLADMTTGEWYVKEFFFIPEAKKLSGVKLYSWFTDNADRKFFINDDSDNQLTDEEIEFFENL
ncbi:hypothetical protein NLC29_01330 [Candidatus Aminicenantes bacterium AH-873-B07]|jgi:hypothetical protein|nr:hypothetical protein [Candidatus Aminicenantes bacterium AH-873-B07]